ncbi:MAG TPA: cation:proton antiporter [Chthoniobacterales bacterium]|nr:cation:proton antiporter [Chthoniobacterales bacterium]
MPETNFLQDLAIVMIVAGLVTVLFHRLKQPVVLGYIVAGVIIGPHTPPFPLIRDQETIRTLSELGVIFLMFSLGLEFSLRKLKEVGATAFIAATLEILVMLWAGYALGQAFGWSAMDSIFLGAILSISSTTIIVKALDDLNLKKEGFARLIFGVLIVEDVLAIVMIALLSGFATSGSFMAADIARTVVKLISFLGILLVAGLLIVPRLLNYVARFKSNEMLLVAVLGLCFGVSLLAVKLEYSVALGAFLIGGIIAEARQIHRIETLVGPVRDMFSAVFFVSIGLLIDPAFIVRYALPIMIISAVVIVGQVTACSFGTLIAGHERRTALRVGMGLSQIGEFSFIIAALGLSLGVTSDFIYPITVGVSALTTLSTPYLIKNSDRVAGWFERAAPMQMKRWLDHYSRWVSELGARQGSFAFQLVRKWGWQIGLNLILVAGIFIAASALRRPAAAWWPGFPRGEDGIKAALWLCAMLLSLPLLIATFRKLHALALLLSEISVTRAAGGEKTSVLRSIVANTISAAGSVVLVLVILLLSSAILPSWELLVAQALVVAAATVLLRRAFVKLYSKAQFALQETLTQPPPPRHPPTLPALPSMLREAELITLRIPENSNLAGKLIGELRLRSVTGATIVGIQRDGTNVTNPGPDEELRSGDEVLLLGSKPHLDSARKLFGVS